MRETPPELVRVVFYDHDYEDSNSEVDIDDDPTILTVYGRVVKETPLFLCVSMCDTIGDATRFNGAPMTVFRILRSDILTISVLRLSRTKRLPRRRNK